MNPLENPRDLIIGRRYIILAGEGESETGVCVALRESSFGHKWGKIAISTERYSISIERYYWTRWHLLADAMQLPVH